MTMTKRLLTGLLCGLLAIAAASQLRADEPDLPITGGAFFFGGASASFPMDMTMINFSNNCFFGGGSGTYGGIPQTPASFTSFCFTGDGANAMLCDPVPMLWAFTFGGNSYSFDLLSLSNAHVESSAIAVTGTGILHATGLDPTPAAISMTGTGSNFSYQFSFVASAVPEPGSFVLAGSGMIVCGAIAYFCRRRG